MNKMAWKKEQILIIIIKSKKKILNLNLNKIKNIKTKWIQLIFVNFFKQT